MPERLNHLAVWIAAIVYFLFGWLWYGVLFASLWMRLMNNPAGMQATAGTYVLSFVLGLILAYATAIALTRRPEDQTAGQGVSFALFMGVALYGTQTLNGAIYAHTAPLLWLLNFGYVLIGFAIIGGIVGGWKKAAA